MAFVVDESTAAYITDAYRARGYSPAFDDLPTESEYDAPEGTPERS
jgi:hypothetical protein